MLKYIGKGFMPGIPARDLSDEEVEKHGGIEFLVETGLYELEKKKKKQPKKEVAEEGE
jgi:hypothetical protein